MGCFCSKLKIIESKPVEPVVVEIPTVGKNPMICKNEVSPTEPVSVESVAIPVSQVVAEAVTQTVVQEVAHVEPLVQVIVDEELTEIKTEIVAEVVQTVVQDSSRKSNVPTQIELYKESIGAIDKHARPSAV
jgi:hypothetical protein